MEVFLSLVSMSMLTSARRQSVKFLRSRMEFFTPFLHSWLLYLCSPRILILIPLLYLSRNQSPVSRGLLQAIGREGAVVIFSELKNLWSFLGSSSGRLWVMQGLYPLHYAPRARVAMQEICLCLVESLDWSNRGHIFSRSYLTLDKYDVTVSEWLPNEFFILKSCNQILLSHGVSLEIPQLRFD